jgi:hypothetical protein
MPISIPAFDQYQSPLVPLRGLWNRKPAEGDRYVNAEIDWKVTTKSDAVQFSLSGNSPVSLSQIVALAVDNSRSGTDVDFIFPDSGFILTVPAHNQVVSPVFTNALMFYAVATGSVAGDICSFQIMNSMPPPIPIAPSADQNHATVTGIAVTNGTTQIIPAGVNGTLNLFSLSFPVTQGASAGIASLILADGAGHTVWNGVINVPASSVQNFQFTLPDLSLRFFNGLQFIVASSSLTAGTPAVVNVYYSVP